MQSDSQPMDIEPVNSSFFSGLSFSNKLTDKQQKLRQNVKLNSQLETKQTSLHQKIQKKKKHSNTLQKDENFIHFKQEKVLVETNNDSQKDINNKKIKFTQKTFQDLRLIRPLMKAVSDVSYTKPTRIQQLCVPVIMSGKDVVASSITGSGKTAAFLLPIIQRYFNAAAVGYIRALIVTPTRELAIQIYQQFQKLNKYTKLDAALVIGASSIQKQEQQLRNNPELVIGTPGRIIDLLMNSRSIGIQNLEMIVFDQADKLLQLGFQAQVKQIMSHINSEVQTILFSATMGKDVNKLVNLTTKKPIRISADPDHKTAEKLHQQIIKLKQNSQSYRQAVLLSVLINLYTQKVIVFFKTKKQCHRIAMILGLLGKNACELHGNLSQNQRIQAFHQFKENKFNYMLATDLAARGLDIKQVKAVVNFELPIELTRYIHRIGRTARAGSVGSSLTLCSDQQCLQLKRMSKKTGDKLFKVSINDSSVKKYQDTIRGLQRSISQLQAEQRQERDMRKADMELKKLQNINEFKDEIYSRPRKQWFMNQVQKKAIQEQAKLAIGIRPQINQKPSKFTKPQRPRNKNGKQGNKKGKQGEKNMNGKRKMIRKKQFKNTKSN